MIEDGTDAAWLRLRRTRHSPPGAAASDSDRRRTYSSALEQAEEMFRAAAVVGPATRPLQLFYGLSQAGRAIAAASSLSQSDWKLAGHGITCNSMTGELKDIQISCGKSGKPTSFVRLSEILDSPTWQGALPLHVIWDSLPSNDKWPILEPTTERRLPLLFVPSYFNNMSHPLLTAAVCYLPAWVINSADGNRDLAKYLSAFPGALGYDSYVRVGREPDSPPKFSRHVDGRGELQVNWYVTADHRSCSEAERQAFGSRISQTYEGEQWFFPDVTGNGESLHPLMSWWAILFTLSMLARYQPAEWARHIDVDNAPYAVAVERILSSASKIVPPLIADTIAQVANKGGAS